MREMTAGAAGGGASPLPPLSASDIMPGTTVDSNGFSGTSGKFNMNLEGYLKTGLDKVKGFLGQNANDSVTTSGYYSGRPSTPKPVVYYDAPFAEKYGMSAETAYQEALSNTAHQREVADLKAAGLNPVLGFNGQGASGVYSASLNSPSYGGSYGSLSSGKSTSSAADKATKLSYWLPTFANGVTTGLVTLKTGNGMSGFGAGQVMQNIISGVLGAIRNHR